ncbi:MAG: hypothetical protein K0R08_234 [Solimicrobium sp.]|nr:hypothetical protein [Solimicrobium sp.]
MNIFDISFSNNVFSETIPAQLTITTKQRHVPTDVSSALQKIISPDFSIQANAAEAAAIVNSEDFNTLLRGLSELAPDVYALEIRFQGQGYIIANSWDQNADIILELKNDKGQLLTYLGKYSLEELRSRLTLLSLYEKLTPTAKLLFHPLFELENVASVGRKSPIVLGDLDGSSARQIVGSIYAGITISDAVGLVLLADVINAEAEVIDHLNVFSGKLLDNKLADQILREMLDGIKGVVKAGIELPSELIEAISEPGEASEKLFSLGRWMRPLLWARFQTDEVIQEKMDELVNHLSFRRGHTPFRCLGDGAHDRFSVNKNADRIIRTNIHKQFTENDFYLLGNHDVFLTKNFGDISSFNLTPGFEVLNFCASFGCFGKDTATPEEWEAHQNEVFLNAYYDEDARTVYSHHGFKLSKDGENSVISTAFIDITWPKRYSEPIKMDKLVAGINRQPRPRPDLVLKQSTAEERELNATLFDEFTGFRPTHQEMQVVASIWNIRMLHGHSEDKNTASPDVIGLNARSNNKLAVAGVRLGAKKRPLPITISTLQAQNREKRQRMENLKKSILT